MGTAQERFEARFTKGDGCWNWVGSKNRQNGYGRFCFNGIKQYAHRASYQIYVGKIADGLYVLHHCDNPACVRPDHLFLGTPADNAHDRDNKGRRIAPSGEKHGQAKLTNTQVREIRTRRNNGICSSALEKEFGVAQQTISNIVHRHTWKKL